MHLAFISSVKLSRSVLPVLWGQYVTDFWCLIPSVFKNCSNYFDMYSPPLSNLKYLIFVSVSQICIFIASFFLLWSRILSYVTNFVTIIAFNCIFTFLFTIELYPFWVKYINFRIFGFLFLFFFNSSLNNEYVLEMKKL